MRRMGNWHNLGEDRAQRKERTFRAIEENPGMDLGILSNLLSLQMRVSPKTILEYVGELDDAGQVRVDMFKAYPVKPGLEAYTPRDDPTKFIEH